MSRRLLVVAFAACSTTTPSTPSPNDVVGPFTGTVSRYAVDGFTLPTNNERARALGDDLNGDGIVDNQVGMLIATLIGTGDGSTHGADMIAAGSLASYLEIEADDLRADPTVAVRYIGADGEPMVTLMGGSIIDGNFRSNRSSTTHVPGRATVRIPVFADADPIALAVYGMELDLDADGRGGFDAKLRGGVDPGEARTVASVGLLQMVASDPQSYRGVQFIFDTNRDGVITYDEVHDSEFFDSTLTSDVELFDGTHEMSAVSIGLGFHVIPCPSGTCAGGAPADRCHDRITDGDETDVDCGGGCQGCGASAACVVASDCLTGACDDGRCRAPSCSDGIQDGFEDLIDHGPGCPSP